MQRYALLLALAAVVGCGPALARDAAVPADVSLELPADTASEMQGRLQSPMPGVGIYSGFGWRRHPTFRQARFHGGVDYSAPVGTPVLAAGEGVIEKIGRARDRGLYLEIRHDERLSSRYSHLHSINADLVVGQRVDLQQPIATVGRSGRSSGPHLDLEVFVDGKRVNPVLVLAPVQSAGNHVQGLRVAFDTP